MPLIVWFEFRRFNELLPKHMNERNVDSSNRICRANQGHELGRRHLHRGRLGQQGACFPVPHPEGVSLVCAARHDVLS